jgi:hypothetical protein
MSEKENDKLDKILNKLDDHADQLRTIQTGIYGDDKNGFPGLIKENKDQEKRIKTLEEFKKKVVYTVGGITLVVPPIITELRRYLGL